MFETNRIMLSSSAKSRVGSLHNDRKQRRRAELLVGRESIAFPAAFGRYLDDGASFMHLENSMNSIPWHGYLSLLEVPRVSSFLHANGSPARASL